MAVRTALGAGRATILVEYLTEGLVLGGLGGALGLGLALAGLQACWSPTAPPICPGSTRSDCTCRRWASPPWCRSRRGSDSGSWSGSVRAAPPRRRCFAKAAAGPAPVGRGTGSGMRW